MPTNAVSTPSGISIAPTVRASVSTAAGIAGAEQHRQRQQAREVGPDQQARDVRDHEPDPADRRRLIATAAAVISVAAAITTSAQRARLHAERARFLVAERQQVHRASAAASSGTRPTHDAGSAEPRSPARRRREAAEQPERDRRQLVVRVGQVLEQRDARAEQRADHHAGQHQHEQRIVAAHGVADHVDEPRPRTSPPRTRGPGSRRSAARGRCRARRRAPRRRTRRGCRARPADCGTGPGTRRRRPRARRRPASAASTRGPRTLQTTVSTVGATPGRRAGQLRPRERRRARPARPG